MAVPPPPAEKVCELGGPSVLSISLRTQLLPEAMKRAAILLAAVERVGLKVMAQSAVAQMDLGAVKLIVAEVVREALEELVRMEASAGARTLAEADAASARLADEIRALRQALRLRDPAPARAAAARAAAALGLAETRDLPAAVERDALGGFIDVRLAAAALDEGRSLDEATRDIRTRYLAGRDLRDIRPAVMVSAAIAAGERVAVSMDMARKVQATGKLMLAWQGDMPLDLFIEPTTLVAFMMWVRRLPKNHGKAHGRNRFAADGVAIDKHKEIAGADERDKRLQVELGARDDLDLRQKRAQLARTLEPRLSDDAVEKHHARVSAIVGAARSELGWRGPAFQSVLPRYLKEAARADNRSVDPLDLRVTEQKKRSVWSAERMSALLTSPIYAGCASAHRRWKPGAQIIRDAFYWLPLIQLTLGPRPEESASLRKDSVLKRDNVHCIRFERRPDARSKTPASERVVPIPEVLLRLGFIAWWKEQLRKPGMSCFRSFRRAPRMRRSRTSSARSAAASSITSRSVTNARTSMQAG